jgi:hypothetical protein
MADQTHLNPKLEVLRQREARLKATISAEIALEQKRERERLVKIVGEALLDEAARSPNFKTMLKQTLNTAAVDVKARRLLSDLGWL